jgi:hypothetical protein
MPARRMGSAFKTWWVELEPVLGRQPGTPFGTLACNAVWLELEPELDMPSRRLKLPANSVFRCASSSGGRVLLALTHSSQIPRWNMGIASSFGGNVGPLALEVA